MKIAIVGRSRGILKGSVSALALTALGGAWPAFAQTAQSAPAQTVDPAAAGEPTTVEETPSQTQQSSTSSTAEGEAATQDAANDVIVVGVREALATAQNIKKNADTFVDSITATDIGAFPDKSVSEALQRVPGLTVNRLQASDDSSHPSGEPTQVLIRGLTQVRTEFNGRDSFSADAARGLNFNDVSPELMAGVDSYKNQTAEMIEGGIAGTVNLRTRLPFDTNGQLIAGTAKGSYGERSDKLNGEFSVLYSNVWDVGGGRFGILGNYARSKVVTRTESVVMDKINTYCSEGFGTDTAGIVNADGSVACSANPFGGTGFAYIPDGIRYSQVDYDREREGIALAAQFENESGDFRATFQYTDSYYQNYWLERTSHVLFDGNAFGSAAFRPRTTTNLRPGPGTSAFTFGSDGMLQSGLMTQAYGSWRGSFGSVQEAIDTGSAVPGLPFVNYCGAGVCGDNPLQGLYFQNEGRSFAHEEGTRDYSANIRWDPSDRVHLNFDAQYIRADTQNDDIIAATQSIANVDYSVDGDGKPRVALLPGSNVNYAEGGLANPHNYWIPFIQGHVEDNDAEEFALRTDGEYEFGEGGWLNSLKVGVRYADRTQDVRYSTFNWTPISAPWNCNGPGFNVDNTTPAPYPACNSARGTFQGYGEGITESVSLGNFFDGRVYDNDQLVYINRPMLRNGGNSPEFIDALGGASTNSPIAPGFTSICDRPEATEGCFTPAEILRVNERTLASYAMLRFGGDDKTLFGASVVGNVGVRLVGTRIKSDGSVSFPQPTALLGLNERPCGSALAPGAVVNPACYLTPQIVAFANSGGTPNSFKNKFHNWLPSFNVRFGLDDQNFIRFAASRALSRPDFGLLRNFVAVQSPIIDTTVDSPFVVYAPGQPQTAANVTGYNFVFRAESGYAALEPITADQFDLSFESYISRTTSFTLSGFYKKLNGSIAYGNETRAFTNNGSTQVVQIRGPRNQGGSGGELYGLEVAGQTFLDFLPGFLSGFGAQANYTLVEQSGIRNSNLLSNSPTGGTGASGAGVGLTTEGTAGLIDSQRLAGISRHTFNLVGLYERGPIGMRVAYNWRSRFLTNNLDCCIGLPIYQKAVGFLDASIRFSVTQNVELSVEGANLLDTTTVYQQQIFGDQPATPGAAPVYQDANWTRNDRRFQFGARVKF